MALSRKNDISFEEIFALPLSRLARPGDILIAISSSGNSPNIVRANTNLTCIMIGERVADWMRAQA